MASSSDIPENNNCFYNEKKRDDGSRWNLNSNTQFSMIEMIIRDRNPCLTILDRMFDSDREKILESIEDTV